MNIYIPQTLDQSISVMGKMDEIEYFVANKPPAEILFLDFWLGSSKDCQTWAMFVRKITDKDYEDEDCDTNIYPETLAVWLTEPPKNNGDIIGAILFDVHEALRKGNKLNDKLIQEIVKSHPFPEYRTVAEYLPVAPKDWLGLPAEMTVGCELSEGACLYREFWDEYQRNSFKGVIAAVFSPRVEGILLNYSLRVQELIPLMPYAVDWPLARRGKDLPCKRVKIQGKVPWKEETDTALLSLYQSVPWDSSWTPNYYAKPTVRLCVPGSNAENAIANWHRIAKFLRKLKKSGADLMPSTE